MNLGRETVRSALWTVSTGMAARIVGLVGTLAITRFIAPSEYGEVSIAAVLVLTANQLSTIGLGQYLVAHPDADRSTAFHVTVFHLLLGAFALGVLLSVGSYLGAPLEAPDMARHLPGLAAAAMLDRMSFVPERILARDLRFGVVSASRTAGDVAYAVVSVGLAALGWGATSIVMGNLVRSVLRLVITAVAVNWREWLEPQRLSITRVKELYAFGVPMAIAALCAFASRRWDNLLVSRFFGAGPVGMYNLAYNLADVPAIQVGEQIGDVLVPSFARVPPEQRAAALVRSLKLLAIAVFPLAVGLAAIAPTLVETLFDERWQPIAPMLVLLAGLSVARPVAWAVASYLQASRRPRYLAWLEIGKLALLLGALATIGRLSLLWTCAAVGVTFTLHMVASLWVVQRLDGLPLRRSIGALTPALAACAPMAAGVVMTRLLIGDSVSSPALRLAIETLAGAIVYTLSTLVVARGPALEFLGRVLSAVRRAEAR